MRLVIKAIKEKRYRIAEEVLQFQKTIHQFATSKECVAYNQALREFTDSIDSDLNNQQPDSSAAKKRSTVPDNSAKACHFSAVYAQPIDRSYNENRKRAKNDASLEAQANVTQP